MHVEIIAIGNEVLSGAVPNTNATFLTKLLSQCGYEVTRHTVLPDREQDLYEGIAQALSRSQLIITTGGLGPTCDDITRKVAAKLFESDFIFDEAVARDLSMHFGNQLASLSDQATVPRKAKVLINPVGTAPGLIFDDPKKTLILLPGVPIEMKTICVDQVLPYLERRFRPASRRYINQLHFADIPENAVDPTLRDLKERYPSVDFGIYPGLGILDLNLSVSAHSLEEAESQLKVPREELGQKFYPYLIDTKIEKLDHAVHERLIEKKVTLSAAESCTGGHFTARLTQLPGASKYLLGSVVAYSNALKSQVLNVPSSLLSTYGAVSAQSVEAMLQGILEVTSSDYAVAVTGIAGPDGGTLDKPVGTVWCAVGNKEGRRRVWLLQARGTRDMVIERSVNALLFELWKQLQ